MLHLVPKRTLQMVSTQVFDYGTKMYEVLHQLDGELNTKRFGAVYSHVCLIQLNVCSLREFWWNSAEKVL